MEYSGVYVGVKPRGCWDAVTVIRPDNPDATAEFVADIVRDGRIVQHVSKDEWLRLREEKFLNCTHAADSKSNR